jgi:hypothetical protein
VRGHVDVPQTGYLGAGHRVVADHGGTGGEQVGGVPRPRLPQAEHGDDRMVHDPSLVRTREMLIFLLLTLSVTPNEEIVSCQMTRLGRRRLCSS